MSKNVNISADTFSYKELVKMEADIENFLEEKELDRTIKFDLKRNKKMVADACDIIQDDFKKAEKELKDNLTQDEYNQFANFEQKKQAIISEKWPESNKKVESFEDLPADVQEKIDGELADLAVDYMSVLDKVNPLIREVEEHNAKEAKQKAATIDFNPINIDDLGIDDDELPDSFLAFVE